MNNANQPIARFLDAAILKPEMNGAEFDEALNVCLKYEAFSVCVRPCDIGRAREGVEGSPTKVCVVLGFPHGCLLTASKADEAARYLAAGVDEIDMVANYGWARSGDWESVTADIAAVAERTRPAGVVLKVIFETAQLKTEEMKRLVESSVLGGADFVKTSTGFNGEGARDADVRLMLETAAGRIRVKPSGGIRDAARAYHLMKMGVHRLGVNWSSLPAICEGAATAPGGSSAY